MKTKLFSRQYCGHTANIQQTLGSKVEFGDFFGDNDNTRNVVVIGSDVAADIFHAQPIGQTVTIMQVKILSFVEC